MVNPSDLKGPRQVSIVDELPSSVLGAAATFGAPLPVGMSLVDALSARLLLSGAGFSGLGYSPCYSECGGPLIGQYVVEYTDPALPDLKIPVYSLDEARRMASTSYYLPLSPIRRVNDTSLRQARRAGQLDFLEELGWRVAQ